MCATFSKLLNLPGPPPLRDASGPGRYGRKDNTPDQNEKVRKHNVVAARVAEALHSFRAQKFPGVETPRASDKQVSILHLDEYVALLKHQDVERTHGLQCPFGHLAAKDTH